ncbi:MAG: fumarylacetoacetate hydrolase family protein [Pseudomonadota bacterium]
MAMRATPLRMTEPSQFAFPPSAPAAAPIEGGGLFPVRRIFCVGKNYAAHVAEMGGDARRDAPVFFTKAADCLVAHGSDVPYPPMTEDLHFEGELVVALKAGGRNVVSSAAEGLVFGFAAGCDLTRRDLQAQAKKAGAPWDMAKSFDASAPMGVIAKGVVDPSARLVTRVNGAVSQDAPLSAMIWPVADVIAELSLYIELRAGDLIFTGTPAGVAPLSKGDRVSVCVDGAPPLEFSMS